MSRPIDADRLLDRCKFYHLKNGDLAVPIIDVQHAPTIELKPKPGEWLLHTYMPHNKYCSCCEKDSPYNKQWDYCPNCGADMRGEEETP